MVNELVTPELIKSNVNPNVCLKKVTAKNNDNKDIIVECGGNIVVKSIDNSKIKISQIAIVNSECGRCGIKEQDEYNLPNIKHTEQCLQGQTTYKVKPNVFLSTVIPDIHWKCSGVISQKHEYDYPCGASVIKIDGGFPF